MDVFTAGPLRLPLPDPATLRPTALDIALTAVLLIFMLRWSVLRTLGVCATLGLTAALADLPGVTAAA